MKWLDIITNKRLGEENKHHFEWTTGQNSSEITTV